MPTNNAEHFHALKVHKDTGYEVTNTPDSSDTYRTRCLSLPDSRWTGRCMDFHQSPGRTVPTRAADWTKQGVRLLGKKRTFVCIVKNKRTWCQVTVVLAREGYANKLSKQSELWRAEKPS